jgi:DNA-binding XRE family transcriptional regulator
VKNFEFTFYDNHTTITPRHKIYNILSEAEKRGLKIAYQGDIRIIYGDKYVAFSEDAKYVRSVHQTGQRIMNFKTTSEGIEFIRHCLGWENSFDEKAWQDDTILAAGGLNRSRGYSIKEAREKAGMTQKAAYTLCEVPERTWIAWEQGDRKPPEYVRKMIVEKLLRHK